MEDLFTLFDALQNSLYPDEKEPEDASPGLRDTESTRQTYEESILVTILGDNYVEFINQDTGQWEQSDRVISTFQEQFEERIRYLFDAESVEK